MQDFFCRSNMIYECVPCRLSPFYNPEDTPVESQPLRGTASNLAHRSVPQTTNYLRLRCYRP